MKKSIFSVIIVILSVELSLHMLSFAYYLYRFAVTKYEYNVNDAVLKVLCLGESTAAGVGASDFKLLGFHTMHSYPSQLQIKLSETLGKKVRVFNMGVAGIDSAQILDNVVFNLKVFDPDLVILQAGHNRKAVPGLVNLVPGLENESVFSISRLLRKIKTDRAAEYIIMRFINKSSGIKRVRRYNQPLNGRQERAPDAEAVNRTYINESLFNLKNIISVIKRRNVPLIVCDYFMSGVNEGIKRISEEESVPLCSLSTVFNDYIAHGSREDILWSDSWHPNDKGYLLIADEIYRLILEKKYLS